jgi:hypothetical protein
VQAWTDPGEPCGGMPRVSRGGFDADAAEAQRRTAATRRSLMAARRTEVGQEQRIGGGSLESGVFFRPGRLRLSGNGDEQSWCRRRVCFVCVQYPVGRIQEVHTYSYIAYLPNYFTVPKLMEFF